METLSRKERVYLFIIVMATFTSMITLVYCSIMLNEINTVNSYQDISMNYNNKSITEIKDKDGYLKLYTYIEVFKSTPGVSIIIKDASLGFTWHILPEYGVPLDRKFIEQWKKEHKDGFHSGKLSNIIVEFKDVVKKRSYRTPPNTDDLLIAIILSCIWIVIVLMVKRYVGFGK